MSGYKTLLCDYCGYDPGTKEGKPWLWNGFYDNDTKTHCCWACRSWHYVKKYRGEFRGSYQEMPVVLKKTGASGTLAVQGASGTLAQELNNG